jgi:hypothetical protein
MTAEDILYFAREAAAEEGFAYLHAYGDKADCGGAWVVVRFSGAAGLAFIKHLKAKGIGNKHHGGGWKVPVCSNIGAQSRIIYEKACDAFVAVLEKNGIKAFTYSYAD